MLLELLSGMKPQKVIIFVPEGADYPDGLQDMIEGMSRFTAPETVRSFSQLNRQLLPVVAQERPIVIALAPTRNDLEGLIRSQELFENTRLIMILADNDEETISLGHRMRPRFISYLAHGFSDITFVVGKMAGESRCIN